MYAPPWLGSILFFSRLYYIVDVRRFEFQAVIKKLLDVKRILLIIVAGQFIVRVLGQVVLVAQNGRTPRSCKMHLPPSSTASSSRLMSSLP